MNFGCSELTSLYYSKQSGLSGIVIEIWGRSIWRRCSGGCHLNRKTDGESGVEEADHLSSSSSNASRATLPGVIREIDIWRVAVLMVNRYADEAKANSDRRAEELATNGDHAGAAIWRRVTVAIEQLTDTTGPPH